VAPSEVRHEYPKDDVAARRSSGPRRRRRWKPGAVGALRVGIAHGAFCAACCWALMLMQMVLGVMNLTVMVMIAAIIGTEKLWKRGPALSRVIGAASIAAGIAVIALWLNRIAG